MKGRIHKQLLFITVMIFQESVMTFSFAQPVVCNNNCDTNECNLSGNDCNGNGIDDEQDIASGTLDDCDGNRIPDECETPTCQPIDVVFLFDVSLSVNFELSAICTAVGDALAQLDTEGLLCIRSEKLTLRINGDVDCDFFDGAVSTFYGSQACDYFDVETLGTCGGCGNGDCEDWGPATAIVAANKEWGPGPRIIIPISDEGPRCGDPIDTQDGVAIDHAIPPVADHRVKIGAVISTTQDQILLANELVSNGAPGGRVFDIGASER